MATWDDAPSTDWNDGEAPAISWADEANAEEADHDFAAQSSYEVPEPPSEPNVDENGRTTGVVKVSLLRTLLHVGMIMSLHTGQQSWRADKAFGFIGRDDGGPEYDLLKLFFA